MIRIVNANIETKIDLSDSYTQLLVIENPREYYKTVCELLHEFDGVEGEYVFVSEDKIVSPNSVGDILVDIFDFDFNDKKLINLLQKHLESRFFNGEGMVQFNETSSAISSFFENLFMSADFALTYNEPQFADLFKACSVKFAKNYDSLIEKIICYINILSGLKKCEFVIIVGLKSVLSDEDLGLLYDHCAREHIALLLIEHTKTRPLLDRERAIIITEDLCEVLENYTEM